MKSTSNDIFLNNSAYVGKCNVVKVRFKKNRVFFFFLMKNHYCYPYLFILNSIVLNPIWFYENSNIKLILKVQACTSFVKLRHVSQHDAWILHNLSSKKVHGSIFSVQYASETIEKDASVKIIITGDKSELCITV